MSTEDLSCPHLDDIQAYLDDLLPAAARARIDEHLTTCRPCQEELAGLHQVGEQLRESFSAPLYSLDEAGIIDAILTRPQTTHRWWLLPALGVTTAAVAACLLVVLWPSPVPEIHQPAPTAPATGQGTVTSVDHALEPAFASTKPGRTAVLLSEDARAIQSQLPDGGIRVDLEAGSLLTSLAHPASGRFVVRTPSGQVEATGTKFVVQVVDRKRTGVWLYEGNLRLTPHEGTPVSIAAPAVAALHPKAVRFTSGKIVTTTRAQAGDPLARIRKLLAERRIEDATAELGHYLAKNPDDLQARFLLGDAHRLSGRAVEAMGIYLKVGKTSGESALAEAAFYECGRLQLQVINRPSQALGTFRGMLRDYPRGLLRQEVFYQVAECHLALKDYTKAVEALETYLRLYPGGTKAREAKTLLQLLKEKGWR